MEYLKHTEEKKENNQFQNDLKENVDNIIKISNDEKLIKLLIKISFLEMLNNYLSDLLNNKK